jgi:hypothetical protein
LYDENQKVLGANYNFHTLSDVGIDNIKTEFVIDSYDAKKIKFNYTLESIYGYDYINKYCGSVQINAFIALINKYCNASIPLLSTDDTMTCALYNTIANTLNNINDLNDTTIHCQNKLKQPNIALLSDNDFISK